MTKKRLITIQYNAPVTLTFALLSLLALALDSLTQGWTTHHLFSFYRSALTDYLTYPRLLLHPLGNPSLAAFSANIVILLVVGPMAEERFSGATVLWAMLTTAVVTGLILWFFFPGTTIMGAGSIVIMLIVLTAFAGARGGVIPLTLLLIVVLYFGAEILQMVQGHVGFEQICHLAAGCVGALFGFLRLRKGK